jgi:hypothetical protein
MQKNGSGYLNPLQNNLPYGMPAQPRQQSLEPTLNRLKTDRSLSNNSGMLVEHSSNKERVRAAEGNLAKMIN